MIQGCHRSAASWLRSCGELVGCLVMACGRHRRQEILWGGSGLWNSCVVAVSFGCLFLTACAGGAVRTVALSPALDRLPHGALAEPHRELCTGPPGEHIGAGAAWMRPDHQAHCAVGSQAVPRGQIPLMIFGGRTDLLSRETVRYPVAPFEFHGVQAQDRLHALHLCLLPTVEPNFDQGVVSSSCPSTSTQAALTMYLLLAFQR